jgi:hypothetical protein
VRLQARQPVALELHVVVVVQVVESDNGRRRASKRKDAVLPMKPAAPVTRIFMGC